jgi:predicted lipid-binding transport protein (Tim44 family)
MDGGFQFVDIILFAMIAAFLILRLRSVLGRRDGTDGNHEDPFSRRGHQDGDDAGQVDTGGDNVVHLPDRSTGKANDPLDGDEEAAVEAQPQTPLQAGLTQIMVADPTFSEKGFLQGATYAFEMILDAFTRGDVKTLKPLLSAEVFTNFADAISAREEAGEEVEDHLVGFKTVDMLEAEMENKEAVVTVKFITEQVNVTRDSEGRIVDGDPNQVIDVVDLWTFRRDTTSRDPNWFLVATHVPT